MGIPVPALATTMNAPRVYDPVWRCIYCGWDEDPKALTKEHIIPLGLAGSLQLPKASCVKCAAITRDFETRCLKTILKSFRVHANFDSRTKDIPSELPVNVTRDGKRVKAHVAVKDHPQFLAMPVFESVGIGTNRDPFNTIQRGGAMVWGDHADVQKCGELHRDKGEDLAVEQLFEPWPMAQMLAKIGHAYATAMLGLDVFRPLLLDTILRKYPFYTQYIGNSQTHLEGEGDAMHALRLHRAETALGHNLVVIQVRLFVPYGMPTYDVVAGELTSGQELSLRDLPGLKPPQHNSGRIPSDLR